MGSQMGILLVLVTSLINAGESMLLRRYGRKHGDGGMLFNAVICLFAAVFFILSDKGGLCFPGGIVLYGIANSLMYAGGFYFYFLALKTGSFIGSSMICSFSFVISVFYGIFFLNEGVNLITGLAMVLAMVSVFMQVYQKESGGRKNKTSLKWFVFALLACLCNGVISILSRVQQIKYDSAYDNEYMFISCLGAFLVLFVFSVVKEHDIFRIVIKNVSLYGSGIGLLNGAKNLVGLWVYLYMPLSVARPLTTGVGYILSFLMTVFIYREPFTKLRLGGVIVGVVAVLLFQL